MTDDPDAPITPPADDTPEESAAEIRSRLQVEPLDELTRTRLVRAALDATTAERSRQRPARWLAAAAIVAVVAVGVSVLVRSFDTPQTTASAPVTKSTEQGDAEDLSAGSSSRSNESSAAAPAAPTQDSPAAIPSLGELGAVGREKRLRAAVRAAKARGEFTAACPTPAVGAGGVLISGGTGTVDGEPASVYVFEVPGAGQTAVAVIDAGCRTAVTVAL